MSLLVPSEQVSLKSDKYSNVMMYVMPHLFSSDYDFFLDQSIIIKTYSTNLCKNILIKKLYRC